MTGEKPAMGRDLFTPVKKIDNGMLVARDGIITAVAQAGGQPAGAASIDLGDVIIAPPLVNAHVHTQLSWLAGKTLWRKGFVPWLASMIPQLTAAARDASGLAEKNMLSAIDGACRDMAAAGIKFIGDIGGSTPGALAAVSAAAQGSGLLASLFCEWFGFEPPLADGAMPWPQRCRQEVMADPHLAKAAAPAGHALYSTSPAILGQAKKWCATRHKVFSFHLAESDEETELLLAGTGSLKELYCGHVLPEGWRQPGMRPLAYAAHLGLLDQKTLAVHGVKLNRTEIATLAQSGSFLCLCPRSNQNLAVGDAPVKEFVNARVPLCLGTDGLTSNTDLDVRKEAVFLREKYDLPWDALWRMLTINGAAALGLGEDACRLKPGARASFSILPRE